MNARILLTATGSGCGKTTITIALLKSKLKQGSSICNTAFTDRAFKDFERINDEFFNVNKKVEVK